MSISRAFCGVTRKRLFSCKTVYNIELRSKSAHTFDKSALAILNIFKNGIGFVFHILLK
jgi:hypothetical protein